MNKTKHHVYGLCIVLLTLGLGLFLYRHLVLDVPLTDSETINTWTVEANLKFYSDPHVPIKASFTIPYMPLNFAILDEYFISQNYGVTTNLVGYNRNAVWTLRRSHGPQSLYYRAIFRQTDINSQFLKKPMPVKKIQLEENQRTAVDAIINLARQSSADIQTFAQSTIKTLVRQEGYAKILSGASLSPSSLINAEVMVLNQANINAIPVQGLLLGQKNKAEFGSYLAVFNGKEWFYLNPITGSSGLPKDFLIWQYGNEPTFSVIGGKKAQLNLTISPTPINALSIAKSRGLAFDSNLLRFSLLQLPVQAQETYKILLTVPIGAFIILILRNFVGLTTFGTFMPVLIALAFRETHLVWGIILFTLIVSLGLMARFYLDQLRLLVVPRLAAILTVVILLMVFISIISQNLGLDLGLSVALFPMIILTMTIERMCITWDERGALEAIKSGVGSLLAASLSFEVMNQHVVQYLVFAFPELLLSLLALILWFGQYRGYRISELTRFKPLAGTD